MMATVSTLAEDKPAGNFAFNVPVAEGKLTLKEIHDIVLNASIARGWEVKEDTDAKIVIHHNRHKHDATVTYLITDRAIDAYCEGYKVDKHGVRKGPDNPQGWLEYLSRDIRKELDAAYTRGK